VHTEDSSARPRRGSVHEQRVPWRIPHPLPKAIDDASCHYHWPNAGDSDHNFAESCGAITQTNELTLTPPIAEPACHELGERSGAFSDSLDDADDCNGSPELDGQEDWQDRVEQFAGRILKEADAREHEDVARQPPPWRGFVTHGWEQWRIHPDHARYQRD
jgi:hypothetical protein